MQELAPEFATAGDKEALTLDFLPPPQQGSASYALVPVDPPSFLQPVHAAFMRAGSQLRLLASLPEHGRRLAQEVAGVSEWEQAVRAGGDVLGGGAYGGGVAADTPPPTSAAATLLLEGSGAPVGAPAAVPAPSPGEPAAGGWLEPAGAPGSGIGEVPLNLGAAALQAAVRVSQQAEAARTRAVDAWLDQLALHRRLAEHAALDQQAERAAALREAQAERAARQAAAQSRQQSLRAALLQEQRAAAEEHRERAAAQRVAQQAGERRQVARAALEEHGAAVAELSAAVAVVGLGAQVASEAAAAAGVKTTAAGGQLPAPAAAVQAREGGPAAAVAAHGHGREEEQGAPAAGPSPSAAAAAAAAPAGAAASAGGPSGPDAVSAFPPGLPAIHTSRGAAGTSGSAGRPALRQLRLDAALKPPPAAKATATDAAALPAGIQWASLPQPSAPAPEGGPGAPAAADDHPASTAWLAHRRQPQDHQTAEQAEAGGGGAEHAAPLPAVVETVVTQGVLSQYRAVSRACVRWDAGPCWPYHCCCRWRWGWWFLPVVIPRSCCCGG